MDDLSEAGKAVERLELDFPVLYDEAGDVIKSYGVFNDSTGVAIPSTFIVDTDGAIRWEFIGSASHRTSTEDIIAQLEQLS